MNKFIKRLCVQFAERAGWLYQVKGDLVFSFLSEKNELAAVQKTGSEMSPQATTATNETWDVGIALRKPDASFWGVPVDPNDRHSDFRSYRRSVASVKFKVKWEDGNGLHSASGITVDVSASGCMAVVGADLALHRKLTITVTESGTSAEGEVVWRGPVQFDAQAHLDPRSFKELLHPSIPAKRQGRKLHKTKT